MSDECKPRVEQVTDDWITFQWEAWCPAHPLDNGDTGRTYDTWGEAIADALAHAREHDATDAQEARGATHRVAPGVSTTLEFLGRQKGGDR